MLIFEKKIIVNLDFNKNDDFMRLKISDLKRKKAIILKGGGKDKIKKQHEKGKLTARERIDFLKDPDAIFFEIGLFAGYEMYSDYGGCPAGGVIAGITYVKNRMCIIVANDATVSIPNNLVGKQSDWVITLHRSLTLIYMIPRTITIPTNESYSMFQNSELRYFKFV